MSKIMIHRAVGLFSLLIFLIFSMLTINNGIEKHILFIALGFILAIASVFAISKSFPEGNGLYWLSLLPFSLLAVAARLIFSWDILLPFILCGYGALAVSAFVMNPPVKGETPAAKTLPLITVIAAAVIYIGLCAVVGVFI